MSIVIPLRGDLPFFDLGAELDGVTYTLQVRWNPRAAAFFLTVYDEPGENVLLGDARMVADYPLYSHRVDRQPPGALVVVDTSGAGEDPSAEVLVDPDNNPSFVSTFGSRHVLLYFSAAELGL